METGRFNAESSSPSPEGDGEREASKKKKKHHDSGASDAKYEAERQKARESEKRKRPAPGTLAPLLERITGDLKPDEERADKAEKKREDRADKDAEKKEAEENTVLERLTAEERRQAAEVYLDEREQRIASEREEAEPDSAEANIAEAVDAFLAKTREKLAADEADVDGAAEESFAEASQAYAPEANQAAEQLPNAMAEEPVAELSAPETGTSEPLAEVPRPDVGQSDAAYTMSYEDVLPHADEGRPPEAQQSDEESVVAAYELPTEDGEVHDEPSALSTAYAYNFQPPQPQFMHNRPATVVPIAAEAAATTTEKATVPVGTALVVGFAAYLLGKRRGRIKAEQRLVPVQKKLEREVRAIHEKLAAKETELRQLVRVQTDLRRATERMTQEVAAAAGVAAAARVPEHMAVLQPHRMEMPGTYSSERPTNEKQPLKPEFAVNDPVPTVRTPEQIAALPITDVPERAFLPRNEMPLEAAPKSPLVSPVANGYERPRPTIYGAPEAAPLPEVTPLRQEIPVTSMTREEVAKAADEIVVGAATVRQVFETGLISERGMRRVVAESKRGGDVRRVLAEEMMIKETGYERDPRLRDQPMRRSQAAASAQPPVRQPTSPAATQPAEENALPVPSSATQPALPRRTMRSGASPVTQSALIAANIIALIVLGILLLVLFVIHL